MEIFIQIASYRDPELIPTIKDVLAKAKYPNRLRFGICRQFSPTDGFDKLDNYKKDKRFRILDIHYTKSQGVGWARNLTQRLYMGEKYTLQIDSHMRFTKEWDVKMTGMLQSLQKQGYKKPMLTGYMGGYIPGRRNSPDYSELPLQMHVCEVNREGIPSFLSAVIPYAEQLVCPVPARFFSGGFYFTLGQFCREVRYDPAIYFLGEEITMALRAYTHGYDLFHPHKMLVWHYYVRQNNPKQWNDDLCWVTRNEQSFSKVQGILGIENKSGLIKQYGLGTQRSLKDYERYTGIRFNKKPVVLNKS